MKRKSYSIEFKQQLIQEALEVGNANQIARQHGVLQLLPRFVKSFQRCFPCILFRLWGSKILVKTEKNYYPAIPNYLASLWIPLMLITCKSSIADELFDAYTIVIGATVSMKPCSLCLNHFLNL